MHGRTYRLDRRTRRRLARRLAADMERRERAAARPLTGRRRARIAAAATSLALAVAASANPGTALATITTTLSGSGALTVTSDGADAIRLDCTGNNGTGSVEVNMVADVSKACSAVTSIAVTGGSGANDLNIAPVAPSNFPNRTGQVTVNGGAGNDTIVGSAASDSVNGQTGVDDASGGRGDDTVFLSAVNEADTVRGGNSGNDVIEFPPMIIGTVIANGADSGTVITSSVDQTFFDIGGANDGIKFTGVGEGGYNAAASPAPVTLTGSANNDSFVSSPWNDVFNAGAQVLNQKDQLSATTESAVATLNASTLTGADIGTDTFTGVEQVTLTSPGGNVNNNWSAADFPGIAVLFPGLGNDTVVGGLGFDTIGANTGVGDTGAGDDVLTGGPGGASVIGGDGTDTLVETNAGGFVSLVSNQMTSNSGGDHNSHLFGIERASITGAAGADSMTAAGFGGSGGATLDGAGGNDTIIGSPGPDSVLGGSEDDSLRGGAGPDTLRGGLGVDSFFGEAGADSLFSDDLVAEGVSCGDDTDSATIDSIDTTPGDCESLTVIQPSSPPPPDPGPVGPGSGTPAPPGPGPAPLPIARTALPPSNLFTFGRITTPPNGTATVRVNVPGAGRVSALATATVSTTLLRAVTRITVARAAGTARRRQSVALTLRPSAAALKVLRRTGLLRIAVRVTFKPTGGTARVRPKTVTLRLVRRR